MTPQRSRWGPVSWLHRGCAAVGRQGGSFVAASPSSLAPVACRLAPTGSWRLLKTVTLLSGRELVDLMQARPLRMFAAGQVGEAVCMDTR